MRTGTNRLRGVLLREECDDLRKPLETEFEGNLERIYKYYPHALTFRWTSCGMTGDLDLGCDDHKPCSCDFNSWVSPVGSFWLVYQRVDLDSMETAPQEDLQGKYHRSDGPKSPVRP